jgi:HEAT repeat protein
LLLCAKEKLVRARTALALGMLKAEQADSKLFYLLEHDDSRSVQRAAALALTYISERTRSELRQALKEGDYPIKLRQLIERFPSSKECVEGQLPTYFDSASADE